MIHAHPHRVEPPHVVLALATGRDDPGRRRLMACEDGGVPIGLPLSEAGARGLDLFLGSRAAGDQGVDEGPHRDVVAPLIFTPRRY